MKSTANASTPVGGLLSNLRSFKATNLMLVAALVVLCTIAGLFIPSFLTFNNLINILRQFSVTAIIAVGMTYVIISGGIDISVGSTVAMSGVVAALALRAGVPIWISILLALASGLGIGLFNGVLVGIGGILPFVATLGTQYLVRGSVLIIAGGQAIWELPDKFVKIGTGYFLGIPIPVLIMFLIYIVGYIILKRFTIGRHIIAIGDNEPAARMVGLSVRNIKIITYGLCGLFAGLAGVILAGRLASGQPSVGQGYELIAIASAVIGGNSLSGGKNSVLGTLLGAAILGVVANAFNLLGVATFFQVVFTGGIVIVAVLADKLRR